MRPRSPCRKNGDLCERHSIGCRAACEEYQKFEEDMQRYREFVTEAMKKQLDLDWKKNGFRKKRG